MQRSYIICNIAALLLLISNVGGYASIQPNKDNVYGHSVVLNGGNQTIWDGSFSEQQFLDSAYAVDAQATPNYVTWTQNEPNYRPLNLSNTANWADGSVTWKFVAPTGCTFQGGTLSMQGAGIWGTNSINFQSHSAYSNSGTGIGGYQSGNGTLYSQDTHTVGNWSWTNWTVQIPFMVSEFYVTAASRADYHSLWGNSMAASGVSFTGTDCPPILPPAQGNALPPGWSVWTENTDCASAGFGSIPVNNIDVQMGNAGQWSLNNYSFAVQQGEVWTLTAVIGGRNVGWLASGGGGAANIYASNSQGITNWALGEAWVSGTFSWRRISVTVTVPEGVTVLHPRFLGTGGGEFFIAAASFKKSALEDPLVVPTSALPPLQPYEVLLPVTPGQDGSLYNPGDTVAWRVAASCSRPDIQVDYCIVDPYGTQVSAGSVNLTQTVSFTPSTRGYFELRIQDWLNSSDLTGVAKAVCGAGVLYSPTSWSAGGNPFGSSGGDQAFLSRLGFTWTRPGYYDIVSGSHNQLPTDFPGYVTAWTNKINAGMPATEVKTVEVWNEPYNELTPGWTMSQFVDMVHAARLGILAADPTYKIAVNWEWVSTFGTYDAAYGSYYPTIQGKTQMDVMVLHPYSMALYGSPGSPDSPERAGLIDYLETAHARLTSDGIPNVEIWSTEYGWPTHPGYGWSTTELNQARYIVRSSMLQLAQGLKRVLPFRMEDVPFWDDMNGSFGLRRADLTPKPALIAYSILAQIVNNLPYVGRYDLGYANSCALVFGTTSPAKSVLVLWSAGQDRSVQLTLPSGTKTKFDLFGNRTSLTSTSYSETIGQSPVYIMVSASPNTLTTAIGKTLITSRPAGIFSGVIDPIEVSLPISIADAKTMPNGSQVRVTGNVAAAFDGFFYIGSSNKVSGIRIARLGYSAVVGSGVTVSGSMDSLPSGERQIVASAIYDAIPLNAAIAQAP